MNLYSFDQSLSTVNKVQREYWMAKQVLKKKFGKEEDRHIIAGDTDIDSKLSQYDSIQSTCSRLVKDLETYHSCVCALARDENSLGLFLKEQGALDPTKAGKMMVAVGKALCYAAQQRLQLRHPLGRLREDIETFRQRAIADTNLSVKKMEEGRTHYRASLLWMRDISANLDPEQYSKLEKYRKVQNEVRINKEKFDCLKWAVCQKVDLLSASRSNLFSNTLVPYQDELLNFWDKTACKLVAVLESFKGYQEYEFKLLKELNPIQLTDSSKKVADNDDSLIDLIEDVDEFGENPFQDPMDAQDDASSSKIEQGPTTADLLGTLTDNQGASKEEIDLWNDLLGSNEKEDNGEFASQWKFAFGDFEMAPLPLEEHSNEIKQSEKDMLNLPGTTSGATQGQQTASVDDFQGFLPSQLLDMHFQQSMEPQTGQVLMPPSLNVSRHVTANSQAVFSEQVPMFGLPNPAMPVCPMPSTGPMMQQTPPPIPSRLFGARPTEKAASTKGKADWYNLFAELDPLQNPDALGKKGDEGKEDGRAC